MTDSSGVKHLYRATAAWLPHLRVSSFTTPLGKEDTKAFSPYSAAEGLVSQATHASWFPLHGWEEKKKTTLFSAKHRGTQHGPDVFILVSHRSQAQMLALGGSHAGGRWVACDLHVPQGTPKVTSALRPLQRDCFRPGALWQSIWRERGFMFVYLNCLPHPKNCMSHTWIVMLVVALMSFLFPSCSQGCCSSQEWVPSSCSLAMALHKQSHSCVVTPTSHSVCVHGKQTHFPSHRAQVAWNNCFNQWHLLTAPMIPFLLSCPGVKKIKLLIRGSQYFPLLSHQMALTSSQKHADTFLPLNLGGTRQGVKPLEGLLGWESFYCNGNCCHGIRVAPTFIE